MVWREEGRWEHTKRTIAIENSTMINKNLKNLAAFGARPTTDYQYYSLPKYGTILK